MTDMFLTTEELAILTGRKMKSLQIQALRQMGIPFFVNAIGHPVVARVAIEGGKQIAEPSKRKWVSNVMLPGYVRPEGKEKG